MTSTVLMVAIIIFIVGMILLMSNHERSGIVVATVGIVCLLAIFGAWIAYMIAISTLPEPFKYWLLMR